MHTEVVIRSCGMRQQIYLPDDLGETIKSYTDLNVSAICQAALYAEVDRREGRREDSGQTTMPLRRMLDTLADVHDRAIDGKPPLEAQRVVLSELYDRLKGLRP